MSAESPKSEKPKDDYEKAKPPIVKGAENPDSPGIASNKTSNVVPFVTKSADQVAKDMFKKLLKGELALSALALNKTECAKQALNTLDPGIGRDDYLTAIWGAQDWGVAKAFVEQWARGSNKFKKADFDADWTSFNPASPHRKRGEHLANLARELGDWTPPEGYYSMLAQVKAEEAENPIEQKPVNIPAEQLEENANLWETVFLDSASTHAYVLKKAPVSVVDARVVTEHAGEYQNKVRNYAGWLGIALRNFAGQIVAFQLIAPDSSDKLFIAGHKLGEAFYSDRKIEPESTARIYLVEGVGAFWGMRKLYPDAPILAVCGAGRFTTVARALHAHAPAAQIVIVPDTGEAQAKALKAAKAVSGLCFEWPESIKEKHPEGNYGIDDLATDHGAQSALDLLSKIQPVMRRYSLTSAADLMSRPPVTWRVRGVLPCSGLAAVFGEPGGGKSALMLDMCVQIATGRPWFGLVTKPSVVTYLVLEGGGGMSQRLQAWKAFNKRDAPPAETMRFIEGQAFHLRDEKHVEDLCADIRASGGAGGIVVIDTLNRAAPGTDENSSKDMGELLAGCARIQQRLGGLVLIVHHSGKDTTKGMRGHSSLIGAVDSALAVSKIDDRLSEWKVSKSRDGESGQGSAFTRRKVPLGMDADKLEISGVVVEFEPGSVPQMKAKKGEPKFKNQKDAYAVLMALFDETTSYGYGGAPITSACVKRDDAIAHVSLKMKIDKAHQKESATRAIDGLLKGGYLVSDDEWLWLPPEG